MSPGLLNITPELSASVAEKTLTAQALLADIARDFAAKRTELRAGMTALKAEHKAEKKALHAEHKAENAAMTAEHQQEQVQQQQEGKLAVDVRAHPLDQARRNFRVDDHIGQRQRNTENEQNRPDQHHLLAQHHGQLRQ